MVSVYQPNGMEENWNDIGNKPKIAFVENGGKETKDAIEFYKDLTLTNQAQNFVENVGMQGVRYIFMNRAAWQRRYLWLVVLLTAMTYTFYISYKNVVDYLGHPIMIKTEMHFEKELEFPAVTLCNYNVFQQSKLSRRENMLLEEMYSPYAVWENERFYNSTEMEDSQISMDNIYRKAAFNYIENIDICEYQRKQCNSSHFYTKIRDIGYCMTFDPSGDVNAKYQKTAGRRGGLSITLTVDQSDWSYGPFMNIKGFIVRVHDPKDEVVMLENKGITLPHGSQIKLIISKRLTSLQIPPYGFCGEKKLQYYKHYTEEACNLECRAKEMIELCGCKREYIEANESVRTCDQYDITGCEDLFIYEPDIKEKVCDCPPACFKIDYDVKVTMAKMAEGMQTVFNSRMQENIDFLSTSIELQVYYPDLSYESETEEPAYSFEKLLCDIGGAAGLFLGASFLTVVELIDFISYILYIASVKKCKNRNENNISVLKDDRY